jgi:ABC-type nitrate/sulfonate/bicarbonate transport system permease component
MTAATDQVLAWSPPDAHHERALARAARRHRRVLLRLAGIVVWLAAWEACADAGLVNVTFTSSPSRIASAAVELLQSSTFYSALGATGYVLLWGLVVTVVVGIPLGLILGRSSVLYEMSEPLVTILYSLPYVLFLPVIIFWFGIEDTSRIVIVVWAAMLPLVINVRAGARNLARDYMRVASVFCTPTLKFFTKVALPATLPFILAGVRLAIGRALVGVVVAEFFLGNDGLGHYVQVQSTNYNMDDAMAGITVLAVAAVLLNSAVGALERRFTHWGGAK